MAAEDIFDEAVSVQDFIPVSENNRTETIVEIQDNGGDLGVQFQQLFQEGFLEFKNGLVKT